MAKSEQFGDQLTRAIYIIKGHTGKNISVIQDELGYALGRRGGATIENWRRGNIPRTSDVEKLARKLVEMGRGKFDRAWLYDFLKAAMYFPPEYLCNELFPNHTPDVMPQELQPGTDGHTNTAVKVPCPYKGLEAFTEEDAHLFFGREATVEYLHTIFTEQDLTVVIGPSGSGKSSLVFAGLLPCLRKEGKWIIAHFRPGDNPFRRLSTCLVELLEPTRTSIDRLPAAAKLQDMLQNRTIPLTNAIMEVLDKEKNDTKFVLIIDQFEELYTQCAHEEIRHQFLDTLLETIAQLDWVKTRRIKFLLTLRADFMGQILHYRPLADALQQHDVMLGPMMRGELTRAIEEPAKYVGIAFDERLVDRILDDIVPTGRQPESRDLPLLEFALQKLWEQRTDNRLTHIAYEAIGQVKGALAYHAEAVYANLNQDEQSWLPSVMVQLVHPGAGTEDTRRVATRSELGEAGWELIQKLAGDTGRLVVVNRDQATAQETAEVVHEALIQRWQRLKGWMDEYRSLRQWQDRLRILIDQWQNSGQDKGALLRGIPLAEAEGWLEERIELLSPRETEFIRISIHERDQIAIELEAQRQRELELERQRAEEAEARREVEKLRTEEQIRTVKRLRIGAVALLVLLLIAVTNTWLTVNARNATEKQRLITLAQSLAAQSLNLLQEHDTELATILAIEAAHINEDEKAHLDWIIDNALRQALDTPYSDNILHEQASVLSVAISSDGNHLASGSLDGIIHVWDLQYPEEEPIMLLGHTDSVLSVAFGPNSQWLVSGSADNTIQLWDLNQLTPSPELLLESDNSIQSVAFSLDGKFFASGGDDDVVHLWDVSAGKPTGDPTLLVGHTGNVWSVTFSPNGILLASGGADKTIRLWDLSKGRAMASLVPTVLEGHAKTVSSVAFSPDGSLLASGSLDQTILLWSLDLPEIKPKEVGQHSGGVGEVTFSPRGNLLVSGGIDDYVIQLWDLSSDQQPQSITLSGHKNEVKSLAFSQDGNLLVSGSQDQTIRLWHFNGNVHLESSSTLIMGDGVVARSLAFSPDGRYLASGGADIVQLQDLQQPEIEPRILPGHKGDVQTVAFGPDGRQLASGGDDQIIYLWDLYERTTPKTLEGHEASIWSLAFSSDGKRLASGSLDYSIRVWDLDHLDAEPKVLWGHDGGVRAVAFSPDGEWLASGSDDQTIRLWKVDDLSRDPIVIWGHKAGVRSFAFIDDDFSNGDYYLISGSDDQTVRVWDINHPDTELIILRGNEAGVRSVAYNPKGNWIASGSTDGTVRLWQIGDDLTQQETEPVILRGLGKSVQAVIFSPDGNYLASSNLGENIIRLWLVPDQLVTLGCQKVWRNLTWEEWQRYLGDEPYRLTCKNRSAATDIPPTSEGIFNFIRFP